MFHEEFSKLIGPYLDGELSAEEREKVENCLADSAECRQLASELEELEVPASRLVGRLFKLEGAHARPTPSVPTLSN